MGAVIVTTIVVPAGTLLLTAARRRSTTRVATLSRLNRIPFNSFKNPRF